MKSILFFSLNFSIDYVFFFFRFNVLDPFLMVKLNCINQKACLIN